MIDRFTAKEKGIDTQKVMKNLDILLRAFAMTKKEMEEAAEISSGYLTRLANPENKKNISMDLELTLENILGIPQFALANEDIEDPNKDDDFVIKVLSKLYKETKSGNREWKENSKDTLKREPYWDQIFVTKKIEAHPFNGCEEVCRKIRKTNGEWVLSSDIYETFLAEDKKIIIYRIGVWNGDSDYDIDLYDQRIEFPLYDFHYEVFLQTSDGTYSPVTESFNLWGHGKLPLKYAIERLYEIVVKDVENKMSKETYSALADYLNQ